MTPDSPLAPCPFCGGRAKKLIENAHIYCIQCGASVDMSDSTDYDAWNRRASPDVAATMPGDEEVADALNSLDLKPCTMIPCKGGNPRYCSGCAAKTLARALTTTRAELAGEKKMAHRAKLELAEVRAYVERANNTMGIPSDNSHRLNTKIEQLIARAESSEEKLAALAAENARLNESIEDVSCEFCDEGAKCCEKFDNSYGEMLKPLITVCTACWNRNSAVAQAQREVVAEVGDVLKRGGTRPDGTTWLDLNANALRKKYDALAKLDAAKEKP